MQKTMAAICMLILVLTLSACSASSAETISGESENTTNLIADGADYVYENPDTDEPNAAIFSVADLTIFGGGTLTVQGNNNDGIASKDGLIIASGTINVTAVDDGVRGKDYLVVEDGVVTVEAGGGWAEIRQRRRGGQRLYLHPGGGVEHHRRATRNAR